jgi:hypothetical protein
MIFRPAGRPVGGEMSRGAQNGMSADHRAQLEELQAQVTNPICRKYLVFADPDLFDTDPDPAFHFDIIRTRRLLY